MTADPTTPRAIRPQCQAVVYVPETYRRVGGRSRFRMHYIRRLCNRHAAEDGYCWQHAAADRGMPKSQP